MTRVERLAAAIAIALLWIGAIYAVIGGTWHSSRLEWAVGALLGIVPSAVVLAVLGVRRLR